MPYEISFVRLSYIWANNSGLKYLLVFCCEGPKKSAFFSNRENKSLSEK